MESLSNIAQTLIYLHAGLGGLALGAGLVAILTTKGSKPHRRGGMIFWLAMLGSAFLAMGISWIPGHENPFLFSIGVFSAYFLWGGKRALAYPRGKVGFFSDHLPSILMLLMGLWMVFYPMLTFGEFNTVLGIFGGVGILFSTRDLLQYRDPEALKKHFLTMHLTKMMSAYIAATTAFVVVNELIPGVWAWFAPSIPGSIFIAYWNRKVRQEGLSPKS